MLCYLKRLTLAPHGRSRAVSHVTLAPISGISPNAISNAATYLDGRGNLSEEALASFTRFFLETCLDQVNFMEELVQPNRLRARIVLWAEEEARLNKARAARGRDP